MYDLSREHIDNLSAEDIELNRKNFAYALRTTPEGKRCMTTLITGDRKRVCAIGAGLLGIGLTEDQIVSLGKDEMNYAPILAKLLGSDVASAIWSANDIASHPDGADRPIYESSWVQMADSLEANAWKDCDPAYERQYDS